MLSPGRGGVAAIDPLGPAFPPQTEHLAGNQLPGWTGSSSGPPALPGPGPAAGGQPGHYDGASGADPARPKMPLPVSTTVPGAWGEGDPGANHGLPGQLHQSFRRFGLQGFNDQLQVRDRHAYYDPGSQRTGLAPSVPGNPPNNHTAGPARPDLRLVNISVNPQLGSDASRNQDDLGRPYSWLGQQDGTNSPVYGGVPGMYIPYGTRGGIPYPVVSPVPEGDPADGPAMVFSGPPHGLHSDTVQGSKQVIARYLNTPQMRPVRLDRPSNSTAAGQSFSQTVPMQGAQPTAAQGHRNASATGLSFHVSGRGWAGG